MSNDLNKLVSEKEELNTKFEALNDQLVKTESERDRTRQEVDSLSLINADLSSRYHKKLNEEKTQREKIFVGQEKVTHDYLMIVFCMIFLL
jgi:uncharacterized coiled-coil DUF342 family protein